MKGLGRVVVGSIAGGLQGVATFFREATEMQNPKAPGRDDAASGPYELN